MPKKAMKKAPKGPVKKDTKPQRSKIGPPPNPGGPNDPPNP